MGGEWGGPVRPEGDPSGWGYLADLIRNINRQLHELTTGAFSDFVSFGPEGIIIKGGAGLTVKDGGDIVVDPDGQVRSSNFDGDLATNNVGTAGWAMDSDAAAFPNLLLRPGSVGNDVLTSPVEVAQGNAAGLGFAVPGTSEAEVAGFNFTVPEGYTRMVCMTSGGVTLVNESVNFDYAFARIFIDTFFSDRLFVPATGNNGTCTVSAHKQGMLPGLTGGQTVRVSLRVSTGGGWGANATNVATVVGIAAFLR